MIAFQILINGELACIASLEGNHSLTTLFTLKSSKDLPQVSLKVFGMDHSFFTRLQDKRSDLGIVNAPNTAVLRSPDNKFIRKEWLNEKYAVSIEVVIRIIEIEETNISGFKEIEMDVSDFMDSFNKFMK